MVVLQKSDNQLYADIVRCLKQNFRSEFQPPFVASHGERKVRIRTGCHYKSHLPEDHWREKYNRNVKQSVRGFYTPAHVPYICFSWRCLFGCKRPRSENSWRWTEPGEGRLKASKHDCFTYVLTFILILKTEKTFSFKPIHHFIL